MFYLSSIPEYYITSEKFNSINIRNHISGMPMQYYEMDLPLMVNYTTLHDTTVENPYINFCVAPDFYAYYALPESEARSAGNNGLPHQHNFYELCYVLRGTLIMKIENETCIFAEGSGCFLNKNVEHQELNYEGRTSIFYLQLSNNFMEQILSPQGSFLFKSEQQSLSNPLVDFLSSNIIKHNKLQKDYLDISPKLNMSHIIRKCYGLCEDITSSLLNGYYGFTHLIKGQICQLFSLLGNPEYYHLARVNLNHNTESVIFAQITYLLEDSNGRISRSALEKILNYNGIYLNNVVKKFTGMTIFEYGTTFCLQKAKELLLNTNMSITQITAELQFTNRTHFYKLFKEKYGMTPKEFRKEYPRAH